MTNTVETQTVTRESVVLDLLTPRKSGFAIALEAGKQRTGSITSVFHTGKTAVWRVVHKEGEPLPHVQLQVDAQVRRVDDVTYRGVIDAVAAMLDAVCAPAGVADSPAEQNVLSLLPSQLRNFVLSTQGPSCVDADQSWTFDLSMNDGELNELRGAVEFPRYPQQRRVRGEADEGDSMETFVPKLEVELRVEQYERKGETRHRLLLSVGKGDPRLVKNIDDAIEAAYTEFDLHHPNQQRHLVIVDGEELEFYGFHTGTRISNVALASHGQYLGAVPEQDQEDGDLEDAADGESNEVEVFFNLFYNKDGDCRYKGNRIPTRKLPRRVYELTTLVGDAS